jgi:hypothetical protein
MLGNHADIRVASSAAGFCCNLSPKYHHIFAAILGYQNIFKMHGVMFPCCFDVMKADISKEFIRK